MTKIYLMVDDRSKSDSWEYNDMTGFSICEDGVILSGHYSSNIDFLKHDLGLNSTWKHNKYKAHCPEGYELVWKGWMSDDDIDKDAEMRIVFEKNKQQKEEE